MIAFLFHTASLYGTRWNAHDIEKRYGIRRQLSAQICGGTADWVGQDFGNRMRRSADPDVPESEAGHPASSGQAYNRFG